MNRANLIHTQAHTLAAFWYDGKQTLTPNDIRDLKAARLYLSAILDGKRPKTFAELAANVHMRIFNGTS